MTRLIPPGAHEQTVTMAEGELRVLLGGWTGEAMPLVLIHGGGTDNAGISWMFAFEAFGGERLVIAPDLPGFGGSVPPAGSRQAVERMPDARLVLVPDTGHWAQIEAPERFADAVRGFLAEIDERDHERGRGGDRRPGGDRGLGGAPDARPRTAGVVRDA